MRPCLDFRGKDAEPSQSGDGAACAVYTGWNQGAENRAPRHANFGLAGTVSGTDFGDWMAWYRTVRGIRSRHALRGAQPGLMVAQARHAALLWDEYIERNPEGYRYPHFCEL